MGMFGSSGGGAAAAYDPSGLSTGDKLMMVGAMMKDAVNSYNGQDSNDVMAARGMIAQRQMMNSLIGAMNGDGSPAAAGQGAPGAAPGGGGAPQLNERTLRIMALVNPQAARALVEQQKMLGETAVGPDGTVYRKYDPTMVGHVFHNPSNVNNTVIDLNDPANVNRAVPGAPVPGAMPVYNNRGEVVDWNLPKGAQQAIVASQAPQIVHNQAMEQIGRFEAGTGRMNAGTQAAAQSNTASQNVVAPPPGFVPRPRKR